jgi:hypothetical protein
MNANTCFDIYFLKRDCQVVLFLTVRSDQVRILTDASRPDGVGTVTQEEKEKFTEIKERLRVQLEYQLTNFRHCNVS